MSIRPCEWDNLSEIFGPREKHSTSSIEYKELMRFLSTTKMSLTELVGSDQDYYDYIRGTIIEHAHTVKIFNLLNQCREIILAEAPGTNILRYLLHKMNNRIIKLQYSNERCALLSNLYFRFECIPFDQMPYCSSPRQHMIRPPSRKGIA